MKGVEAPFQLLISVFTMILVVAIAFHVLNSVSKERCVQQWDQGIADLATTIVRVAMSEPPTTASTELRFKCGDSAKHKIEIMAESGARCSKICGEIADSCYVLLHTVYNNRGDVIYSKPTCLRNMSPYLYYLVQSGVGSCPSGYTSFFSSGATIAAEQRSVGAVTVYVFRDSGKVEICTKSNS